MDSKPIVGLDEGGYFEAMRNAFREATSGDEEARPGAPDADPPPEESSRNWITTW